VEDLREFFDSANDRGFVDRVHSNTTRYINIFSQVIDAKMPLPTTDLSENDFSPFDVMMQ